MDVSRWTRRGVLGSGAALAWLSAVRADRAEGGEPAPEAAPATGLATGAPVPLPYEVLPGFLSKEQLALHHDKHYAGALKALKGVEDRAYGPAGVPDAAARRELGRVQSEKANSVILHELYFAGMAAKAVDPAEDLRTALAARFGSLDRWRADFEGCALAANGWAMLALHPLNGRLYHVVSDAHDVGPLWFARPLLLIDMYEHAYYVDYKNDKATYVKSWFDHVDWPEASRRLRSAR